MSSVSSTEFSAPSNIALIKYMGKTEASGNHPTNSSLSYTLEYLRTFVRLTPAEKDHWKLLRREGLETMELSAKGQERFVKHFQNLKRLWNVQENFLIESANNFPSDCGLASSASSFAALTLAAARTFQKINPQSWGEDMKKLSELSRQGSGSSCRSLFSPWALWQAEYAEPIKLEYNNLHHIVIIVEAGKKEVSSSEAHKLVATSPRFEGRVERAEIRLKDLIHALRFQDWNLAVQICWDEFMDMHRLFETSTPPFSYMNEDSKIVLQELQKKFASRGDGPIVTMDAGANIHLFFRQDQKKEFAAYKENFGKRFKILASPLEENSHV